MNRLCLFLIILAAASQLFAMGSFYNYEDEFNVRGFSGIENNCYADVFITLGRGFDVYAVGSKADVLDLDIYERSDVLHIDLDSSFSISIGTSSNLKVYVTLPDLEGVYNNGSGDMVIKDNVLAGSFIAEVHGSGDIAGDDIRADVVDFISYGSGDIDFLNLDCTELNMETRGSGSIVANDCYADEFNFSVMGSGSISGDILAGYESGFSIQGSGDIDFERISVTILTCAITGSGDIGLTGDTDTFALSAKGSGDFEGKQLTARRVKLEMMGSGDVDISIADRGPLSLTVFGSSDVSVYGNPSVQKQEILGSGSINIQ